MDDKEYNSRVTQLFVEVMDIVRARRRLRWDEERLARNIVRFKVDARIMAILDNEYERSLEETNYTMKTVPQIREDLEDADAGG